MPAAARSAARSISSPRNRISRSNFFEVTTTVGTDNTFRTTLDANQKVSPDFAVRANLMYDQHDVAGRDITDSERWGGLISATARLSDDVKVTLDYYRYRNDAMPDWGVPVRNIDNVPVTELGAPRNMWVGMKGLDFFKEEADIGTATVVAKLADGVTLTNRSRVGESSLDYVATSMEGYPDVHHPNRDQTARIYANQTELNFKFNTGTFHHDLVAGVELTRETIDRWLQPIQVTHTTPIRRILTRPFPPNPYDPLHRRSSWKRQGLRRNDRHDRGLPDGHHPLVQAVDLQRRRPLRRLQPRPGRRPGHSAGLRCGTTAIATNTASVQADLLSWHTGIVYKPIPIASFYVAYATAQSPIGSELDSTGAQYNGISATLVNVPPQEARSVEVGTKWELFNKRLLATAALFQTDVDHARTNDNVTATDPTNAFNGKYRVRGIELGAAGNITKDWSVFGGLVLLDTEVLKSSTAQDIGRRLANIPLTQFSLLSQVPTDRQVGDRRRGDLRRRGLWRPPRRQRREQPYRRLVALRRLRGVQAHATTSS